MSGHSFEPFNRVIENQIFAKGSSIGSSEKSVMSIFGNIDTNSYRYFSEPLESFRNLNSINLSVMSFIVSSCHGNK